GDLGREEEGLLDRVTLARLQPAGVGDTCEGGRELPGPGARGVQVRRVRQVNEVTPALLGGLGGALVLHGPADGEGGACRGFGRGGHRADDQVGGRRQEDRDRASLVVVVV